MKKPQAQYSKQAHLMLCSSQVSCNNPAKGRAHFDADALKKRWRQEGYSKVCFLQITGCMGLCELGNSGLLILPERTLWLGGLTPEHLETLMAWLNALRKSPRDVPPLPEVITAQEVERLEVPTHVR